jgi:hypothetical protein
MKNFLTYTLTSFLITSSVLFTGFYFSKKISNITNAEYGILSCINKKVELYQDEVWEVTGRFEPVSFEKRQIFEEECRE